jgi:hypothetical protein
MEFGLDLGPPLRRPSFWGFPPRFQYNGFFFSSNCTVNSLVLEYFQHVHCRTHNSNLPSLAHIDN